MLTEDAVKYLKEKYYGHKLIYVRFSSEEFIFRTLSKNEYKYIKANSYGEYDFRDKICNLACIYPEDYDFSYSPFAGVPDKCAPIIEEQSGFTDINVILQSYYQEKELHTLETQCMDMIKAFIPEYTYEEMREWTWHQLMTMTAHAEKVAKLKGFDYALNDKTGEMEEEYNKMNSDNPDFIKNLYEHGVDPMIHFKHEIEFVKPVIEFPLIMGVSYDNEVVIDAVRKQINKKTIEHGRYLP